MPVGAGAGFTQSSHRQLKSWLTPAVSWRFGFFWRAEVRPTSRRPAAAGLQTGSLRRRRKVTLRRMPTDPGRGLCRAGRTPPDAGPITR